MWERSSDNSRANSFWKALSPFWDRQPGVIENLGFIRLKGFRDCPIISMVFTILSRKDLGGWMGWRKVSERISVYEKSFTSKSCFEFKLITICEQFSTIVNPSVWWSVGGNFIILHRYHPPKMHNYFTGFERIEGWVGLKKYFRCKDCKNRTNYWMIP